MLVVYNILQIVLLLGGAPLLLLLVLGRGKYRGRIRERLGFGLTSRLQRIDASPDSGARIWIHCLSVGEVTSALPLIRGLRLRMPAARIIVSVTTRTGMRVAEQLAAPWADLILASPLDLLPVVRRFIRLLRPDLFILVETDFWPNWLHALHRHHVPAMLVNGRISGPSFARYRRFRFFFRPLFSSFALLAVQTEHDAAQLRALGVPARLLRTLGNLKYARDAAPDRRSAAGLSREELKLPSDCQVWVCGSTHAGEEELLLPAFASLAADHPRLCLLLAPRDPQRAPDLVHLAHRHGLDAMCRSCPHDRPARVLILDTLGELAACYQLARLAFVGGSLVLRGGHNMLEASRLGVPVLFGPHTDDFKEIAGDLLRCGGAQLVATAGEIAAAVRRILEDDSIHAAMRAGATELVNRQAGVVDRHLALVTGLLDSGRT